jgi:trehalose 6-phosphate synthase
VRLSLRFVLPLIAALSLLAYGVTPLVDQLTLRWFMRDLDLRASLVANTLDASVALLSEQDQKTRIRQLFTRVANDERLYAIAYCASPSSAPIATVALPSEITCASADSLDVEGGRLVTADQGSLLLSVRKLSDSGADTGGRLILLHDLSFVDRRSAETRKYLFYLFLALGLVISLLTVVIAQLSFRGWVRGLRSMLRGERIPFDAKGLESDDIRPIAEDVRALIRDLEAEHRLRDEEQLIWSPHALRELLNRELRGQDVIIVSNREPYIHTREGDKLRVQRPASGLVTAVEPVMRACSGTWIAHGSGSADREVVDRHDRVAVPIDDPAYQLRRVWLTREEEMGYYYGFANEGLWPLCHISHVRPVFRTSDWDEYRRVNKKFAEAVAQEAKSEDPIVLVQDYHFALLPRMIRDLLPNATIVTFWHIPWPNPEAFGICPWRRELVDGLLGSSILGFHTQFHSNNFVDTVDRFLEARVDRETFNVSYRGARTAVKRYPISIEWPPSPALLAKPVEQCADEIRRLHGLPADHALGVGVDRLDYTKGIEERFRAVERLLERYPQWVGKFTFIQIAAPTRAIIDQYHDYEERVVDLARKINDRFPSAQYPPIILAIRHHEPVEVYEYYRAADLCFVSSLHDGMNLVAKEFVAARDDERGVLVLSQFTGAARELPEALIVNPYDIDQCATALNAALTMPVKTQRARMRLMRGLVRDFNVYRWAGRMLIDAAAMRRSGRVLGAESLEPWAAPTVETDRTVFDRRAH